MTVVNRRSHLLLYNSSTCLVGHRIRIVLAEKGVEYDVCYVDPDNLPEKVFELNGSGELPILAGRDVVLYKYSRIITEYIDERFPHPPLLPVDPVEKAIVRITLERLKIEWFSHVQVIEQGSKREADKARKLLRENILSSTAIFGHKLYFMSDEFTLLDAYIAPLMWRLPYYKVKLPAEATEIHNYCERIFSREGFKESLTEEEMEMRNPL